MSRCSHLALLLLVACEQATPAQHPAVVPESAPPVSVPVQAQAPEPAPAPEPIAEIAPSPRPAIAPVKPKPIKKAQPAPPPPAAPAQQAADIRWKLRGSCDPRSRVGCRWQRETDERELPRVTKKPVVDAAEQP